MVFAQDLGFEQKMRPPVEQIFEMQFPGCQIQYTREQEDLKQFDDLFAIDTILTLPSGQIITAQQKCRRHTNFRDFTQEYMNAVGTPYEGKGEWFHLAAQLYFYGWANQNQDGFVAWALIDVVRYKMLVEESGGLERVGTLQQNRDHGRASFYAIPIETLRPALIGSHGI